MDAIATRRSIRRFASRQVPSGLLPELIAAACAAPAPHHGRPWRFVEVSVDSRQHLVEAMTAAWRSDLEAQGQASDTVEDALGRSRRQVADAPLLLLACLDAEGARRWRDQRRRRAERDMYMQSLGAALQNLLLAAHARGLAGYLKGAPLFCRQAVRRALRLPPRWQPAFLVLLGYPARGLRPSRRPAVRAEDFLIER